MGEANEPDRESDRWRSQRCSPASRLTRFLDDGRIELDTSTVKRAMRPITLNRKDAPFAAADGGAEHWVVIASLVEICKLNDANPYTYLAEVLERLAAGHPQNWIEDVMLWAYRANADV